MKRSDLDNPTPTRVYLGLGSNLGDRASALEQAIASIASAEDISLVASSPVYETPPMGPQNQGAYLNQAVVIETYLTAAALMASLQQIESSLGRAGREDREHWGPREIDIDLLLFGDQVIDVPGLSVPHPGIAERWFVLKPLFDLSPQLVHPVSKKTVARLLDEIPATDSVQGVRV